MPIHQRVLDRFKPSIRDRLNQSQEAKKRHRNIAPKPEPKPIRLDTGRFNESGSTFIDSPIILTTNGGFVRYQRPEPVWQLWTSNTTALTSNETVWYTWNSRTISTSSYDYSHLERRVLTGRSSYGEGGRIQVAESEEHKRLRLQREAAWQEEERQYRLRLEKEEEAKRLANERAITLLKSCMTKEQRACYEKNRHFFVRAKSGRIYRIDHGTHGNVKVVNSNGEVLESLCIQPNGVPTGDSMLAQKLLIETAEDVFRRHANITLKNGTVLRGTPEELNADKLADVIPLVRAA